MLYYITIPTPGLLIFHPRKSSYVFRNKQDKKSDHFEGQVICPTFELDDNNWKKHLETLENIDYEKNDVIVIYRDYDNSTEYGFMILPKDSLNKLELRFNPIQNEVSVLDSLFTIEKLEIDLDISQDGCDTPADVV